MTQKQDEVQLTETDMMGMGMSREEIDVELAKRQPVESQEQLKEAEDLKLKQEKENADKLAAEKAEKDKKAGVIDDMLFRAEREAKRKAYEEQIVKAREERKAKMTPEEIAAENEAVEAAKAEAEQVKIDNFTLKQNSAFAELQSATDKEEWALIMPAIGEFINSKEYDEAIARGVDPVAFTAQIVRNAKAVNIDKIVELKSKKAQADAEAQAKIENLKSFNQPKQQAGGSVQKTELEELREKADSGKHLDRDDTARLIWLEEIEKNKPKK